MTFLYSQYASGTQFTAGTITGSALGVSGINPIVDRLNSIAPSGGLVSGTNLLVYASGGNIGDKYDYEWIDNSPSFIDNLYVSEDIWLNQNLSGCKVKASYYASGLGSMTWDLYKVSGAGDTVNETLLGSASVADNNLGAATFNTNSNTLITKDSNYFFYHDSSLSVTGSEAYPQGFVFNIAYDSDNNNVLSVDDPLTGSATVYIHNGSSAANVTGSFSFKVPTDIMGITYDTIQNRLLSADRNGWVFTHSGVSSVFTGSFFVNSWSSGMEGFKDIAFDTNNGNLIAFVNMYPASGVLYVHSGVSSAVLGSFTNRDELDINDVGFCAYMGNGSLVLSKLDAPRQYMIYNLGMEQESLISGLSYNTDETFNPAIAQATYPKIRLKVNRSMPQNKLHKVKLEYE